MGELLALEGHVTGIVSARGLVDFALDDSYVSVVESRLGHAAPLREGEFIGLIAQAGWRPGQLQVLAVRRPNQRRAYYTGPRGPTLLLTVPLLAESVVVRGPTLVLALLILLPLVLVEVGVVWQRLRVMRHLSKAFGCQ